MTGKARISVSDERRLSVVLSQKLERPPPELSAIYVTPHPLSCLRIERECKVVITLGKTNKHGLRTEVQIACKTNTLATIRRRYLLMQSGPWNRHGSFVPQLLGPRALLPSVTAAVRHAVEPKGLALLRSHGSSRPLALLTVHENLGLVIATRVDHNEV